MATTVTRLRDVGDILLRLDGSISVTGDSLGCAQSVGLSLDSEILRARCGAAISERYQGVTSTSLEVVSETLDPCADFHPGDSGELSIVLPGAPSTSGIPTVGDLLTVNGTITNVVRRFPRNELATGSYTFRARSIDGVTCPITYVAGSGTLGVDGVTASTFVRDISSFEFTSSGNDIDSDAFCPESVEITEATELIEDSCQGQIWPTYVGITGLNVSVTATGKGVKHGFDAATGGTTCVCNKGFLEMSVAVGDENDCAALTSLNKTIRVNNASIVGFSIDASTGEIATITLEFVGHGSAGELTDPTLRAVAVISTS